MEATSPRQSKATNWFSVASSVVTTIGKSAESLGEIQQFSCNEVSNFVLPVSVGHTSCDVSLRTNLRVVRRAGPRTCRLPGCSKPCYVEGNGKVHDYCGRTHAQQHGAMSSPREGGRWGAGRTTGYARQGSGVSHSGESLSTKYTTLSCFSKLHLCRMG